MSSQANKTHKRRDKVSNLTSTKKKRRIKKQSVRSYSNITIGSLADDIIKQYHRRLHRMTRLPEIVKRDRRGLVARWHYPDVILTFKCRYGPGSDTIPLYRVTKIERIV